jgi:hypothetical protein
MTKRIKKSTKSMKSIKSTKSRKTTKTVKGGPVPAPAVNADAWADDADEERGVRFFELHRIWRIFHDDRGRTMFSKAKIEAIYHEDYEQRQDRWKRQIEAAATPEAKRAARKERHNESESRRQHIKRFVEMLQNIDVPIEDVDSRGRGIDKENRPQKTKAGRFTERFWRYNPDGQWARRLDHLFDTYGIQGYELVGIMACRSLLSDLHGLPQLESVRGLVDRMTACLPPAIREEAIELSRAWRYSLGDTTKYASPDKKVALACWYDATILRRQVDVEHRSPGKDVRVRRLAALGTMFDREENAIYLLGSEEDPANPGMWKCPVQWKFDRIAAVRSTGLKNPPLSALMPHHRVRAASGPGPERLDIAHLYSDSVGAFFRYGQPTIRLEALVHSPGWMAWCVERPFHPKQRVSRETDAAERPQLRLVVDRCDEEEIASRLLRLGGAFTVVSPPSLVDKIKAAARRVVERHENGT